MTLQQKLDKMKERMAEKGYRDDNPGYNGFEAGFTAAAQLLLPLVEALEAACPNNSYRKDNGATNPETCFFCGTPEDTSGFIRHPVDCGYRIAREALSTLERRIEEGGKR